MKKIVLVDDDAALLGVLQHALQQANYDVAAFATPQEALEAIQATPPDLLISDIVMPEMDGIEMGLMASLFAPDVKIILMSGFANERRRAVHLDHVIDRILAKPFALAEFLSEVETVLNSDG